MPKIVLLPLLTIAEAAREANVAYNTVKRAVEAKELEPFQDKPHTILISVDKLKHWTSERNHIEVN